MPGDPPAHVARIIRPQIGVAGTAALHSRRRRIPGRVESEHGARRHADAAARDDAKQHGAGRGADAVDLDLVAAFAQGVEAVQIFTDLAAIVVGYSDRRFRRSKVHRDDQKNRRCSAQLHGQVLRILLMQ